MGVPPMFGRYSGQPSLLRVALNELEEEIAEYREHGRDAHATQRRRICHAPLPPVITRTMPPSHGVAAPADKTARRRAWTVGTDKSVPGVGVGAGVFRAGGFFILKNAAFIRMNAAFVRMNAAFVRMNAAFIRMNAAFVRMNAAFVRMNAAFVRMNAAFRRVNAAFLG